MLTIIFAATMSHWAIENLMGDFWLSVPASGAFQSWAVYLIWFLFPAFLIAAIFGGLGGRYIDYPTVKLGLVLGGGVALVRVISWLYFISHMTVSFTGHLMQFMLILATLVFFVFFVRIGARHRYVT